MKSRIIMPTRTNRILRAVSRAEGEKEIPLERRNKHRQICLPPLLAGAPVQKKSWSPEAYKRKQYYIIAREKKRRILPFFCRDTPPLSLRGYPERVVHDSLYSIADSSTRPSPRLFQRLVDFSSCI